MLKIAALMLQEEIDNAPPKPRRSIERFRTVAPQFPIPLSSLVALHLPPMGLPHDRRQIACNMGGLSARVGKGPRSSSPWERLNTSFTVSSGGMFPKNGSSSLSI